ncbi:MAG: hypothetical protein JNJ57_08385, partial [Saprospiraceae bacterium]|nr:hypothetical protein [Saprospiraceae bacterium]
RSTGNGTWDNGPYAIGGDKQWMVIDTTNGPGKGHIYTHWTSNYTACTDGVGNFTRSIDDGDSYEECERVEPNVYWGTCAVGPDGVLYISGANDQLARSSSAQISGSGVTWEDPVFCYMGGGIPQNWGGSDPNPAGLKAQRWVAVNHAPGPQFGEIYQLQSVHPDDDSDPADVMFTRSTDGGATWSAPIRVNDDNEGPEWQWFGTMSVAPNGRIDAVWLDTRDNPGTVLSSLYYAYSTDGGQTWSENERLSDEFDPLIGWPQQQKIGDYYHMVSDNQGAHLAWSATFTGGQDVYYGRITLPNSSVSEAGHSKAIQSVTPNPFSETTTIYFDQAFNESVEVQIFQQNGALVESILVPQGRLQVEWDGRSANGSMLPNGVYFGKLTTPGTASEYFKVVLMR